jgi:hypothetical protein
MTLPRFRVCLFALGFVLWVLASWSLGWTLVWGLSFGYPHAIFGSMQDGPHQGYYIGAGVMGLGIMWACSIWHLVMRRPGGFMLASLFFYSAGTLYVPCNHEQPYAYIGTNVLLFSHSTNYLIPMFYGPIDSFELLEFGDGLTPSVTRGFSWVTISYDDVPAVTLLCAPTGPGASCYDIAIATRWYLCSARMAQCPDAGTEPRRYGD